MVHEAVVRIEDSGVLGMGEHVGAGGAGTSEDVKLSWVERFVVRLEAGLSFLQEDNYSAAALFGPK